MSLRHGILGVLTARSLTGWDLSHYLGLTVSNAWSATSSQIYAELRAMEDAGLIRSEEAPRGQRGRKRFYSITEAGEAELRRWVDEPVVYPPERDIFRLKMIFFDITTFESMRQKLRAHQEHYEARRQRFQNFADRLTQRIPDLLRDRLRDRPAEEHEAISELKAFAFIGLAERAQWEIDWAERALDLVDSLEQRRTEFLARRDSQQDLAADN